MSQRADKDVALAKLSSAASRKRGCWPRDPCKSPEPRWMINGSCQLVIPRDAAQNRVCKCAKCRISKHDQPTSRPPWSCTRGWPADPWPSSSECTWSGSNIIETLRKLLPLSKVLTSKLGMGQGWAIAHLLCGLWSHAVTQYPHRQSSEECTTVSTSYLRTRSAQGLSSLCADHELRTEGIWWPNRHQVLPLRKGHLPWSPRFWQHRTYQVDERWRTSLSETKHNNSIE